MSLHLLIDGYNVIRKIPCLAASSLEAEREALVRFIEERRPQGSSRNSVTVVFDGSEDVCGWPAMGGTVRVLFSRGESADDLIKRLIEQDAGVKEAVLVSDDMELVRFARHSGAQAWSVAMFAARGRKNAPGARPAVRPGGERPEGKVISGALESRVNRELEALWLRRGKA
jgi:predicted RNA-binding protein with PIN domain